MKENAFFALRFLFVLNRSCLTAVAGFLLLLAMAAPVRAGGGGENILLVVNPNDEPSLRIANAYVQARHIPANNIFYLVPPGIGGFTAWETWTDGQFASAYGSPILGAIAARGLTNQIDYIGIIGQVGIADGVSLPCALCQLTQVQNGVTLSEMFYRESEVFNQQSPAPANNYVHGTNAAIHHSTQYPSVGVTGTATYAQWYLSGVIGNSGLEGLTTTEVIQNLQRTAAGDGTKPAGTMYFEWTNDIRTEARSSFWPSTQAYMTANGIPWIQEGQLAACVPANRKDVMGAEIGSDLYSEPNGSIYLPGSWADDLTSGGSAQTLYNTVLLSGGGGSSGTLSEPTADSERFPLPALNIFSYDGSTLGEAFYMAVETPDLIQFQGDLLSQAYADIPTVAFASGPANNATVSGSVSLSGSAFLPNLNSNSTATGIAKLSLFVDGLDTGVFASGASGTFTLNTMTLTDGVHEVRLVAYNNSAAASQGRAIRTFLVNNLGESVSITGSASYDVASSQAFSIPVSAVQGSGAAITQIQLQSLGRVVGSVSGLSGNVALSGTSLAFGNNTLTPVAILSNGGQVQGWPITVDRGFQTLAGAPSTPSGNRIPGCDICYYPGVAQESLAATNLSGTPAYVVHSNNMEISPASGPPINMPPAYCTSAGGSNVGLGVVMKSSFSVTTPGEYSIGFTEGYNCYWTSFSYAIDGVTIGSCDLWIGGTLNLFFNAADTLRSAYLLPGEHTLKIVLLNYPSTGASVADDNMGFQARFRGPDPNIRGGANNLCANPTGPTFYTVLKNTGH